MSLGRRKCLLPGKDTPTMEIYVSTSKKFFSILDIVQHDVKCASSRLGPRPSPDPDRPP